MKEDCYFLPAGYVTNQAVSFDQKDACYWDEARANNSLAYQVDVYDWALRLIKEKGLRSIADVGCGNAAKLAVLHRAVPKVDTWGLDQPNAIELCRRHYDFGSWFPINLDQPGQLPEIKFDLIVSSDVIEHLENPDVLLEAIRCMSHRDTLVLLSTPERIRLRGVACQHSPNAYHVREWSKQEFASYLHSRHYEILDHRVLPAFKFTHDIRFFQRALRRWVRLKSISYNQAVLTRAFLHPKG